jgi:Na+/melibiose symporter-like transporter
MYLTHSVTAERFGVVTVALLFVVCYLVYIVGYSCQFCVTRAAQSALTNDPKQRPVFAGFDMVLNILLYVGVAMAVSNYLEPKYGGFTTEMFGEFFILTVIAGAVCTALAVLGIRGKDREEYYGGAGGADVADITDAAGDPDAADTADAAGSPGNPNAATTPAKEPKATLRDYLEILKNNKSVAPLLLAAGIDKLCANVATNNAAVGVIIYGIICGNYALMGQMNMYVFMPSLALSLFCVWCARRIGQKRAFLLGTYGALVTTVGIFLLFAIGDPRSLSFTAWGPFTILLLLLTAVRGGFMSINNSILVPMVADVSDSEVARSGRYAPGVIGAMFSFTDKLFTQLNNVAVGLVMIAIGFGKMYPTPDTPPTPALFGAGMFCLCGLPAIAWVVNILCMRAYPLGRERMDAVQKEIAERKHGGDPGPNGKAR